MNFQNFKYLILAGVYFFFIFHAPRISNSEGPMFAAVSATEARMSFSHFVEIAGSRQPSEVWVNQVIERQVAHLFGAFSHSAPIGTPKNDHQIQLIKIEQVKPGLFRAFYNYIGTVVAQNVPGLNTINLFLPRNPESVFNAGAVIKDGHMSFPCTDDQHPEEQYFWYFWSPNRPGCPLKAGVDYDTVAARIERTANTKQTFPEYNRLVDRNGDIQIFLLFGMDNPNENWNPMVSRDINAETYRRTKMLLERNGFQSKVWATADLQKFTTDFRYGTPYVETLDRPAAHGHLVINMFFGPTSSPTSYAFAQFFNAALSNAAVVIYSGHSGLGAYVSPTAFQVDYGVSMTPAKERYQILFFNSCSSYSYYNREFFALKASALDPYGTKNLDIMANGLATLFSSLTRANFALLNGVINWADLGRATSWQDIVLQADSGNLLSVNGDEDNPVTPPGI